MHYIITILSTILFVISFNEPVMSSWDFAVTTKGQINFYGTTWKQLTSAAHQFDTLSALAFDETDETLYFNDQSHTNGSIFSLKLSSDENHRVEKLLQKTKDELIQGMAFDPLERILYWTDAKNKLIYQMSVDGKDVEPTILLKLDETKMPHGIAVDVCRRKLYWTNANHLNPSIERASLDGTNYEVLIDSDLFMPSGIVVDQYSKQIYWVDDRPGIQYSVESAKLDGTDRQNITQKLYNVPFNLAVDESGVFWTDVQQNAIWRISKNTSDGEQPQKVQSFTAAPKAIVVRNHLLSSQTENPDCKPVLDAIKMTLLAPKPSTDSSKSPTTDAMTQVIPKYFCLNDGVLNPKTDRCICPQEFKGDHCEIPICHNYCIEGTCYISSTGYAQCECHAGFIGERCEINLCNGYCLNGGRCDLENKEPVCHCGKPFYGRHCEAMDTTEMCNRFCNNEEIDAKGMDLISVCNNCSRNNTLNHASNHLGMNTATSYENERLNMCTDSILNKTALFVSVGVVISLLLVFVIVTTIRCRYKPLRPRIKKTYVVHKNITPTPLTCRPTTEQCEITIENCCNMNICDTPCFDPKTLQAEAAKKDDKKTLLNHTDGDLMF